LRVERNINIIGDTFLFLDKIGKKLFSTIPNILSFLVASSLFVSITLFSVIYLTFYSLGIPPDYTLFFASFLVTFSIYNLNKLTDVAEDTVNTPDRSKFVKNKNHLIIFISTITYASALIIGVFSGEILAIILLLIPLWIAILYSIRLHPELPRLKDIFLAKSISVTTGWVLSIVILSFIFLPKVEIILFWSCFLFIKLFINSVLFDVRDLKGDNILGIKTVPAVLGVKKTRKILLVLQSLLLPWIALVIYYNALQPVLPILLFGIFYGYWYILHFCREEKKRPIKFDLAIDGEWIILGCFVLLFQYVIPFGQ
jgi:4-hydroxybenzoate polyprenyltransferase